MINLVKVKFKDSGKIYDFDAQDFFLKRNDKVVVETEHGIAIGSVVVYYPDYFQTNHSAYNRVIRKVNNSDLEREQRMREKEEYAFQFCARKITERALPMKLVSVEFQPNGAKATFYFSADGRIDFRELVKDLAKEFHARIQMRQIGVRDEAKLTGGVGRCGKTLCCSTWLKDFVPVSIKSAKDQSLPLNPTKVSGVCGRLLCCLTYEHEIYIQMSKGLPKVGRKVVFENEAYIVKAVNTLKREIGISNAAGVFKWVAAEALKPYQSDTGNDEPISGNDILDEDIKKLEEGIDHIEYEDDNAPVGKRPAGKRKFPQGRHRHTRSRGDRQWMNTTKSSNGDLRKASDVSRESQFETQSSDDR